MILNDERRGVWLQKLDAGKTQRDEVVKVTCLGTAMHGEMAKSERLNQK